MTLRSRKRKHLQALFAAFVALAATTEEIDAALIQDLDFFIYMDVVESREMIESESVSEQRQELYGNGNRTETEEGAKKETK